MFRIGLVDFYSNMLGCSPLDQGVPGSVFGLAESELQIIGGIEDNSKIIFLNAQ